MGVFGLIREAFRKYPVRAFIWSLRGEGFQTKSDKVALIKTKQGRSYYRLKKARAEVPVQSFEDIWYFGRKLYVFMVEIQKGIYLPLHPKFMGKEVDIRNIAGLLNEKQSLEEQLSHLINEEGDEAEIEGVKHQLEKIKRQLKDYEKQKGDPATFKADLVAKAQELKYVEELHLKNIEDIHEMVSRPNKLLMYAPLIVSVITIVFAGIIFIVLAMKLGDIADALGKVRVGWLWPFLFLKRLFYGRSNRIR